MIDGSRVSYIHHLCLGAPVDSHFSKDTLRENLKHLANRATTTAQVDPAGRAICAEARFDVDHTVQRLAYLAHLTQESTN